ncbi:DUF805 domain-containing protein [Sphingorhabdus sp.]|uniref:DUF805 domain-containing protein n=1 Tax=Sphingorhabdus sp. TaxID=1902408 RepID=UPI0038FC967C
MNPYEAVKTTYIAILNGQSRIRRAQYAWFLIWHFLFTISMLLISITISAYLNSNFGVEESYLMIVAIISIFLHIILFFLADIKRLHDINASGVWMIAYIFGAAIIMIPLLIFKDGSRGKNDYGPSVKYENNEET